MARTGQWERQTMAACQQGIKFPNGGGTGSFCKKRDLCRQEGRCHFVTRVELHEERMQAIADQTRRAARAAIHWTDGFDDEPDMPLIVVPAGVTW
jgi:23S rRNA A2030 N6-methylase RlmJ